MLSRLSAIIFPKKRRRSVKCRSGLLVEMLWVRESTNGGDLVPAPGFRFVVTETWKSDDGRTICNVAMVDKESIETGIIVVKKGHGRPKG